MCGGPETLNPKPCAFSGGEVSLKVGDPTNDWTQLVNLVLRVLPLTVWARAQSTQTTCLDPNLEMQI